MTTDDVLLAELDNEIVALDIESTTFDDSTEFANELIEMAFG